MEKLHPKVKWAFRINSYFMFFFLLVFLGFGFFMSMTQSKIGLGSLIWIFVLGLIIIIFLVELFVHLTYINWKYEFTPDSLKIEKGVIVKRYNSIPYERVQNVDITRGILARILGFSSIEIHTAGYSGMHHARRGTHSEGYLPGVSVQAAEKIREFLIKKISHKKSTHSGL